jgi:putative membrane protein
MLGFGHFMGGWGWGWGWGWPMAVSSLIFWVLVAVAIVALIRYLTRTGHQGAGPRPPYQWQQAPAGYHPPGPPSPEQILAERFARGEIDEQEFRARLGTLRSQASNQGPPPEQPPPPQSPSGA